ncbi:MAG: Phosphopentomutase [Gemmatimonadaceae bacterium]|nr:Phosphopentomutase [Gemmatimonadaceae bacterium]
MNRRAVILVLDGVGIGVAHDAEAYGDAGSDTLGNIANAVGGMMLPSLDRLGLGRCAPIRGLSNQGDVEAAWGTMQPQSAGKDSTTGHWEIAGLHLAQPFPTFPNGFPRDLVAEFSRRTRRGVLGNSTGSGTAMIERFATEQAETGSWIVYTSADSVFQVAAHEGWIPLQELYRACEVARVLLAGEYGVSRVIARPFLGAAGEYRRTPNRRDFSIAPTGTTLLDELERGGIPRFGVGKVDDLFAGRGIVSRHTADNTEGIRAIVEWLDGSGGGLLFANLVDFDQQYGHRNDVAGFYGALRQFDEALPSMLGRLRERDLFAITADHGNDPTTPSTDHTRERVPVLITGSQVRARAIGERPTFSDLGATVAEWFGLVWRGRGQSFLPEIVV